MKFKSALMTDASGSIGGMTASRNRGGLYLRSRVAPVDPNTASQNAVRNAFAQLASQWASLLTTSQREAWDEYADQVEIPNPFGDPKQVSGINMYCRSNAPRIQADLERVDDAPTVNNTGEFTSVDAVVTAVSDDVQIDFDDTDPWVGETGSSMLVYASRPQDLSINFFRGPYRFAGSIDGDATTPPTTPATIALPFPVTAGRKVFLRIRVSRADGRLSFNQFLPVVAV